MSGDRPLSSPAVGRRTTTELPIPLEIACGLEILLRIRHALTDDSFGMRSPSPVRVKSL